MSQSTHDRVAPEKKDATGPAQPERCTQVTTLYEQPTYAQFVGEVKKWIRTCVQEGRENELLDNNASLEAAWERLQQLPTPMALGQGRQIKVKPVYSWEVTSGPPHWRATQITFVVQEQHTAPPLPSFPDTPDTQKPDTTSKKDHTDDSTTTPADDTYYYCSGSGIKKLSVPQGQTPAAPSDARS